MRHLLTDWSDETKYFLSMSVTILLLVALVFYIFSEPEEPIVFDFEAELQQCMDESDHQFRLCVDDMTERFKNPED